MTLIDQAIVHHQSGNLSEAESLYRRILEGDSRDFDALHMLGIICGQRQQFDEAERLIRDALAIDQNVASCHHNYGKVLAKLNRFEDAIDSYNKALAIAPNDASVYSDRGDAQKELDCFEEARASYDKALTLCPDLAEAWLGRGNVFAKLDNYDDAISAYDKALTINPTYDQALCNRGLALHHLGRFKEALASYTRALTIDPEFADAHFDQSFCQLLHGDFKRGWTEYEWRWRTDDLALLKRNFQKPLWRGREDIAGKTILLHAEQGLGDTIQFCRYAELVAAKGAKVILEVPPPLKGLLANVRGVERVLDMDEQLLPDFDYHCPLLSLPLAFDTRLDSIPARVPYLQASPDLIKRWSLKLGKKDRPRIGIAWSGNAKHANNRSRSIVLGELLPLTALGLQLVSLQTEVGEQDQIILDAHDDILHFGGDFSETAALVSLMDVVISVDTSIAHLAGALGAPTWVLLSFAPDWRWLLDRDDSPWYPTAKLFRQPRIADWDSVIQRVLQELTRWNAKHP